MAKKLQGAVGLLGGTFNPVHNGHLRMALEVREALDLARVDFLPAKSPAHKAGDNLLDYSLRLRMIADAISGVDGLGICTIEGQLPEPSYSLVTLMHLQNIEPKVPYAFVLGSNDLLTLLQWHQGRQIPYITDLIVVGRAGVDQQAVYEFLDQHWDCERVSDHMFHVQGGRRIFFVPIPRLDISSSLVRKKICLGQEIFGLVPDLVRQCLLARLNSIQNCWDSTSKMYKSKEQS